MALKNSLPLYRRLVSGNLLPGRFQVASDPTRSTQWRSGILGTQLSFVDEVQGALLSSNSQTRGFWSSTTNYGRVEVEVQSMGESISEGTIAEVLKTEGDTVEEDEVIAQIDTDKVTIDLRAPSAGHLVELKIKAEDTVKVGQTVAVIDEGEAGSKGDNTMKPQHKQKNDGKNQDVPRGNSKPEKTHSASARELSEREDMEESHNAYRPLIDFPQRMTAEGKRISDLNYEEQSRYSSDHSSINEASSQSKQAQSGKFQHEKKHAPWYVGREQGTKLSQSRVLTQFEMDQIELGGAEPY